MDYSDYDNPQWDVDRVKLEFKSGETIILSVSPYLFAVILKWCNGNEIWAPAQRCEIWAKFEC